MLHLPPPPPVAVDPALFEDAQRRVVTANSWDVASFESEVGRVADMLALADAPVVLHADWLWGLRTWRIVLTAIARSTNPRRLHVVIDDAASGSIEGKSSSLSNVVHASAMLEMAQSVGVGSMTVAAYPGDKVSLGRDPIQQFLLRNDSTVLPAPALRPLERLILEALLAHRHRRFDVALSRLQTAELTAQSREDLARVCSIRAVMMARIGGARLLREAEISVYRGLAAVEGVRRPSAGLERGWLYNNGGLLSVLAFLREGERRHLESARGFLTKVFGESRSSSGPGNEALCANAAANAIRLLELEGRFPEALGLFRCSFPDPTEPEILYRGAVLELRCGGVARARQILDKARKKCGPSLWPFHLAFLRALAACDVVEGRDGNASALCEEGLELALVIRSRTAAVAFGGNLIHCLARTHRGRQSRRVRERLKVDEGIDLSGDSRLGVSPPPSKLAPYVPEIDLAVLRPPRHSPINQEMERRLARPESLAG
ncbi:MAG: hypothetical protein HOP28_06620 [Gemmatimonadales bacterium]|nr:hypothetical protein [Gemmatimonadales bacterium]